MLLLNTIIYKCLCKYFKQLQVIFWKTTHNLSQLLDRSSFLICILVSLRQLLAPKTAKYYLTAAQLIRNIALFI